ncbi:MAG: hypothetical protein U0K83_03965 [Bacteroidales bacterium]|nr:hypothetical protein [Bacteroidales bacterium]
MYSLYLSSSERISVNGGILLFMLEIYSSIFSGFQEREEMLKECAAAPSPMYSSAFQYAELCLLL